MLNNKISYDKKKGKRGYYTNIASMMLSTP